MKAAVLICDGDQRRRVRLAYWLDDDGYDVVIASSGMEALARVAERPYACVLLDLLLPGLSGLEVLAIIRGSYPRLPVVAMAEENSLELERRARIRRVFYYLVEATDREELRNVLASATHRMLPTEVVPLPTSAQERRGYAGDRTA